MIIASLYPCPFDSHGRHDATCSIIKDGEIFAYEEEKLTTIKQEETVMFPERSLMMGCKELNILPSDIDKWVFPTMAEDVDINKMFIFFSTLFKIYKGSRDKFEEWFQKNVYFVDHQISHAALAVLTSGFKECAFLSQDGGGDSGDRRNFIFGEYCDRKFQVLNEHQGLKNICAFHAFITDSIGFARGNNGKTTGLACYGQVQPVLLQKFEDLINYDENGINFIRERYSQTEINLKKIKSPEYSRAKILNRYPSDTNVFRLALEYLPHDIAATGEFLMDKVFLDLLKILKKKTSMNKLVLSGGIFLNVTLNNKILESNIFDEIYVPMAPSDVGLSLGAALYIQNEIIEKDRNETISPYLGPSFKKDEIKDLLDRFRLHYTYDQNIAKTTAQLLAKGEVVGWFQGRAEYGPRSLGARSILADPRNPKSKSRINQLLKKRDWFMPYAPSILEEYIKEWVEIPHQSRYMQVAFQVKEDKKVLIPAAVHMDGSSRIQTVNRTQNGKYWDVIESFRKLTGIPLILNTSFNRHGIATISNPRQAVEHLLEGCMDYLVIDDFLVSFSKNRMAIISVILEKDENVCLAEDCIRRLNTVLKYGNAKQVKGYIERLSQLIGINFDLIDSEVIIESQERISVEKIVDILIEKVNNLQPVS